MKMKKVALFFAVALVASMTLTSCSGDYTCACEYSLMGTKTTPEVTWKDVKKSEAQDACDALATQYKIVDSAAKCELK